MCRITKVLKEPKTVTGYKLVIKIGKDFYSPSTGLKYKAGMKIPKMKKLRKNIDNAWGHPFNDRNYEPRMQGMTGIYSNLNLLLDSSLMTSRRFTYSILEIKLGNVLYEGTLGNRLTYVGDDIIELKEILVSNNPMGFISINLFDKVK